MMRSQERAQNTPKEIIPNRIVDCGHADIRAGRPHLFCKQFQAYVNALPDFVKVAGVIFSLNVKRTERSSWAQSKAWLSNAPKNRRLHRERGFARAGRANKEQ